MSENMKPVCEEKGPLTDELLRKMNAYWRATNYLAAGQLYLLGNPLLYKTFSIRHCTTSEEMKATASCICWTPRCCASR